ncbi:MAG: right-handed parallel beta-helix repeat-containing protein [Chloroflexi bacterium]|nr:right-handed parallel beta-helix repeat-containing protein [Chloroflexota bacterium]
MATEQSRRRRLPRWAWFILTPIIIIVLVIGILAALPVEADDDIPEAEWGVGASNIEPAWTGLQREFPAVDENINAEMANLGYQLFFDPVMSGNNDYSCAHCHHPDLGFADGQRVSLTVDGRELTRNAPSLWNLVYQQNYFWDGRADTLEKQFMISLSSDMELNQDGEELVDEIAAIEAYQTQFDSVFDNGVTLDNITAAIVEFERTLVSDNAPYDAYVQGNFEAITSQQRRGLEVFRSAATRCFECHAAPTFANDDFKVVGVPDEGNDVGRGAVEGVDFAFKVPTLRNVVLNGPYMHNGAFESLDEVLEFYGMGAGNGVAFEGGEVDRMAAAGFNLGQNDLDDLMAFLYSLTDETVPERYREGLNYLDDEGRVVIPTRVPSGSEEIVESVDNPARDTFDVMMSAPIERPECERDAENQTVTVGEGQTIQQAVDCAEPGDTILVPPGVYHERVSIDLSDITLRGIVAEEPQLCPVQTTEAVFPESEYETLWPVLDGDVDGDGTKDLTDGVIASGNNFTMEYFIVRNYTGNGVLVEGVRGITLRHLFTSDTGLYGVYPVRSDDVLVECNVTRLASDAGIYVGQSRGITVRNNLAYDGVTGIEIENSVDADVYENETWGNTGGILVFLLPNLHSRISEDIRVFDNYVHDNNRPKGDATPGSIVGKVPIGTGIFVMATDDTEIYNNRIENNDSFGIGLVSLYQAYEPDEIGDVGPLSENNHIHDNEFANNGSNPDQEVEDAGLPGADILWDARGFGNVFDEPDASMFPPVLPTSGTPGILERAMFQIWNFLGKNL